ncbi:MAG: ECF transporter S component [Kineosporiaceae bacterium]
MSTTENTAGGARATGPDRPDVRAAGRRLTTLEVVGVTVSVLLGAAVWAVGLPSSPTLFGTPLSDLTVPVALLVALTGVCVVGAAAARSAWRVVHIVVASVLGVAGGFFLWGVAVVWEPLTKPLSFYPPAAALAVGLFLVPGVLGGLVVRKPGAAVYTELVAALLEALLGNQWGFSTVYYGLVEGLGAEVVLAVLLYRTFGVVAALGAGAGAGVAAGVLDSFVYFPSFSAASKAVYIGFAAASGAVVAGLGAWALTRALATSGALAPLASGRTRELV